MTRFTKLAKVLIIVAIIIALIASVVLSQISLMIITYMSSDIKNPITECHLSNDSHNISKYELRNDRNIWIFCSFLVLISNNVIYLVQTILKWRFRSYKMPQFFSDFILVLLMETLSSIGSALMVLILYPSVNIIKLALIQWSFYLFPSLVNVLNSVQKSSFDNQLNVNHSSPRKIIAISCFMTQFLVIFIWTSIEFIENERLSIWLIPFCVYLLSLSLWHSYVHNKSEIKLISKLAIARDNISQIGSEVCQIIVMIWKIVLSFVIISFFIFIDNSVHMSFEFNRLLQFNELIENTYNVTNGLHESILIARLLPIDIISIYVITSIISSHLCNRILLKIPSKRIFTYFLSLTITPIALFITFLIIYFVFNDKCERISKLPQLEFVNLNTINDKTLLYIFIPLSVITFLSFIGIVLNTNWFLNKLRSPPIVRVNSNLANIPSIYFDSQPIHVRKSSGVKYHVFLCPTMWHEEDFEMEALIGSLINLYNEHQKLQINYQIETHIFIDDAFDEAQDKDGQKLYFINSYVKNLIKITDQKNNELGRQKLSYSMINTPYGEQIHFHLAIDYKLIAHLKNRNLIRKGKRWSQVMYMNLAKAFTKNSSFKASNIFVIALDGDTSYPPKSIFNIINSAIRNPNIGAVSGKLIPISHYRFNWIVMYQKFEYSVSYWLQKTVENIWGSILCSPGCFTLYRAEAIFDVMAKYSTKSYDAFTQILYGQGEDRWLTTLLMKSGWLIEYCSSAVAYTHSPTTMDEYIKQRLRWIASTMINNLHFILISNKITKYSKSVSWCFVIYHTMVFIISILTPANVLLMLSGAYNAAFPVGEMVSFGFNLLIIIIFCLVCFLAENKIQILCMKVIGGFYALSMIAVLITTIIQISDPDGYHSPTFVIFVTVCVVFSISALLHPSDFVMSASFLPAMIYYTCGPMMIMLLPLYSLINMNVVSWGTREKTKVDDLPIVQHLNGNHNGIHFKQIHLDDSEAQLWNNLVTTESGPLNPNQDNSQSEQNKLLRTKLMDRQKNKYTTIILILNSLFIALLIFIELHLSGNMISIIIPIINYTLEVEPTGLVVLLTLAVFFGFQFMSLIIHRYRTMWRYISDDKFDDDFDEDIDEFKTLYSDKYEIITRF